MQKTLCIILFTVAVYSPALSGTAKEPIKMYWPCPSGSPWAYGVEITEDRNGDGTYDYRSVRNCNGQWSSTCIPSPCGIVVHADPASPSDYQVFTTAYNSATQLWTWTLTEYDNSIDMNVVGTLERRSDNSLVYTDYTSPPTINQNDEYPGALPMVNDIRVIWAEDVLHVSCTSNRPGTGIVEVIDMQGQVAYSQSLTLEAGSNLYDINLDAIYRGCYIVRIRHDAWATHISILKD